MNYIKRQKKQQQHIPSLALTMLFPRLLNAADLDGGGATIPSSVTPQRFAGCNHNIVVYLSALFHYIVVS